MSVDPASQSDAITPAVPAEHRTIHVHRHRRRRRFVAESEALARRREDLRALSWILPCCLLALGALILFIEMRNPEPAARAKDVVAIGVALLGAGAVWLAAILAWRWIAVVREWRRGNDDDFRRHHHHRHGSSD